MRKTSVQSIELKDGSCILVEVEEMEDVDLSAVLPSKKLASNRPPGTEEIGFARDVGGKVKDVAELLRQTLSGLFETVAESMKKSRPDEWGVEVSIGFKATKDTSSLKFVPIVLSGEANAAIKVHAKWTKDKEAAQQNG